MEQKRIFPFTHSFIKMIDKQQMFHGQSNSIHRLLLQAVFFGGRNARQTSSTRHHLSSRAEGPTEKQQQNLSNKDDGSAEMPVAELTKEKKEIGGPKGPEPTRFGDWERKGRCCDF